MKGPQLFKRNRERRGRTDSHAAAVLQWRRHDLLHKLLNQRPREVVLIEPEVARSLRRDGLLIEKEFSGDWAVTAQGVAAHARWGQGGPGRFPQ